jgi:hypothetical protein
MCYILPTTAYTSNGTITSTSKHSSCLASLQLYINTQQCQHQPGIKVPPPRADLHQPTSAVLPASVLASTAAACTLQVRIASLIASRAASGITLVGPTPFSSFPALHAPQGRTLACTKTLLLHLSFTYIHTYRTRVHPYMSHAYTNIHTYNGSSCSGSASSWQQAMVASLGAARFALAPAAATSTTCNNRHRVQQGL